LKTVYPLSCNSINRNLLLLAFPGRSCVTCTRMQVRSGYGTELSEDSCDHLRPTACVDVEDVELGERVPEATRGDERRGVEPHWLSAAREELRSR
jgi:hypothetical protein